MHNALFSALINAETAYMKMNGWSFIKTGQTTGRWSSKDGSYLKVPHDLAVQIQKDIDRKRLLGSEAEPQPLV